MKDNKKYIIGVVLFAMAIVLVVVVLTMLMQPKQSYTSKNDDYGSVGGVDCRKNDDIDAFFDSSGAEDFEHTIKATFRNDNIDKMSYTYEVVFPTEEVAERKLSQFHADYNIFMGDVGLDIELLTPNFSRFSTTDIINLYVVKSKAKGDFAKLLFLTNDEMQKLTTVDSQEFAKIYQNKGFECNIKY